MGLEAQWGCMYGYLQHGAPSLVRGVRSRLGVSSPPAPKDIKVHSTHPHSPSGQRDLEMCPSEASLTRTRPSSEVKGMWMRPKNAF